MLNCIRDLEVFTTIIGVVITTTYCSVTNVSKEGQQKEPCKWVQLWRAFTDEVKMEMMEKAKPIVQRWWVSALHIPKSLENSKVTRKYY